MLVKYKHIIQISTQNMNSKHCMGDTNCVVIGMFCRCKHKDLAKCVNIILVVILNVFFIFFDIKLAEPEGGSS